MHRSPMKSRTHTHAALGIPRGPSVANESSASSGAAGLAPRGTGLGAALEASRSADGGAKRHVLLEAGRRCGRRGDTGGCCGGHRGRREPEQVLVLLSQDFVDGR